ncbi:MAG: HNH endonuclease [Kamptonema sp. SIO4C4]|nr:HNH endonuclease [Kamptonema sp. SIO4C4]
MTSITETLNHSVVVFSKNYLPLNRINIRRAIVLLVTGKAEPVDFLTPDVPLASGWQIKSPSLVLQVPPHIRLTMTAQERVWKVPAVNRREVLKRDKQTCQYCGSRHKLTLDHVIPRSKGGKHCWENVVTACERCNGKKGDRTPEQAGMPLKNRPKAPTHPTVAFAHEFWQQQRPS